jgi:nucleotide-binding universal stress UspA family protein
VPRPIVIGYVAEAAGQAALMEAAELAKLSGSKLVIVFAYEIPAAYGGGETGDYRRTLKELAEQATDDAVERVRDTGVEYEVALVPKRPVDALLEVAAKMDAQMIAVGTHGEHPLTGAILGSVPHKLLHVSTIPVLVVPGKKTD